MDAKYRMIARRQLDERLQSLAGNDTWSRPNKGWIRAIREAIGMTATQLAQRMGVSQPRIHALEKAEVNQTVTLETLARAAEALDCRLVYAFMPRQSLEETVKQRAYDVAHRQLGYTSHSMALEAQGLRSEDDSRMVDNLARKLIDQSSSKLWESLD